MSLLNQGNQAVTVFPEETVTDWDGNRFTRASSVGIDLRASVQPIGTPTEDQDRGFNTGARFRLRLAGQRGAAIVLGPRALVEWRGKLHSIEGVGITHESSRGTEHTTYTMMRS